MTVHTVKMNTGSVPVAVSSAEFGGIFQRNDGILLAVYRLEVSENPNVYTIVYSTDYGLTWSLQDKLPVSGTGWGYEKAVITSDYKVAMLENRVHDVYEKCEARDILAIPDEYTSDFLVDSDNNYYAFFYFYEGDPKLGYKIWDGASWSTIFEIAEVPGVSTIKDVAIDSLGNIHIVYRFAKDYLERGNSYLYYATNASGSWVKYTVHDSDVPAADDEIGIVVDGDDDIHIAYATFDGIYPYGDANLIYGKWNGSSFDEQTIVQHHDGGSIINELNFVRDGSDVLFVIYGHDPGGGGGLDAIRVVRSIDGGSSWGSYEDISKITETASLINVLTEKSNFPGYNLPKSGFCGFYEDTITDDTYFFYDDGMELRFASVPTTTYCDPVISGESGAAMCEYIEGGQIRKMVTTVSDIDHLEGEAIKVQMDGDIPRDSNGDVVTNSFTVSGGQITLPKKAAVVHAGLGYDGIIKFLRTSDGSAVGTGQMKMRRLFLSVLRLYKTLGLQVGLDADNIDPMFDGDVTDLYTGDQKKVPNAYWDEEIEAVIKQDKPLPANILAALFRSEVEEKL